MVLKGGCGGWFRSRTNLEKTLLSLSCLLLITLLVMVLVSVAGHSNSGAISVDDESECFTSECIRSAGEILSKMNEMVDPCSNFYEYACGNYGKSPGETTSTAQRSVDSVYLSVKNMLESEFSSEIDGSNAVKSLYSSCMEFEGLHRVKAESAQILLQLMRRNGLGSWHVLDVMYEDSDIPISGRLAALAVMGVPVAFSLQVVPDPNVQGSHMLEISPGGPLESGRLSSEIRRDDDLRAYMLFSFLLLGAPNYLRATSAVDDILSVESYYAKVEEEYNKDGNKRCDSVDILAPDESIRKLNNLMPEMNWTSLVTMVQKEAGLQRPFAVQIHCKAKIREYLVHLEDLHDNELDNYFGWRFFESFSRHIGPAFQRRRSLPLPRWKECVRLLEKYASPPLAEGITLMEAREGVEEQIHRMSNSTVAAAERLVSKAGWLDQDHQSKTLRQMKQTKVRLPYLKKTNGTSSLRLPNMNIADYTSAVISLRRKSIIRDFKSLNPSSEPNSTEQGFFLTSETSTSTASSVAIYFDKLREPYFRQHGSDWMNMGGFGTFISRELFKNVLSVGVESSIGTVWESLFENRNANGCFFDLFSRRFNISAKEDNAAMKELYLDAGSLELALESAKSGANSRRMSLPGLQSKSNEQLFFIAYAQTLCQSNGPSNNTSTSIPMKNRLNAILRNSQDFEDAFSCSYSHQKCPVFI